MLKARGAGFDGGKAPSSEQDASEREKPDRQIFFEADSGLFLSRENATQVLISLDIIEMVAQPPSQQGEGGAGVAGFVPAVGGDQNIPRGQSSRSISRAPDFGRMTTVETTRSPDEGDLSDGLPAASSTLPTAPAQDALPSEAVTQRLLTKAQVAAYVQCTSRCVDNWMKQGYLPYFKIGRSVRFKLADVDAHLAEYFRIMRQRRLFGHTPRS